MRDSCNFLFLVLLRSVNGMLSIDEIKQLIELIDESTLDEFELETKDSKILLKSIKQLLLQRYKKLQLLSHQHKQRQ